MSDTRHLVTIRDLSKDQILHLLKNAASMKKNSFQESMKGKILASCFFEPSTRTRLSFEAAMLKLGGQVIGFSEGDTTSSKKGETLSDAIRIVSSYADIIILRHPLEGAARLASQISKVPVINAGDGSHEHPSQTLLDLFSIFETQNSLENLHIGFAGDLLYSRTVHSLAQACTHFNTRLYFVSPQMLMMPDHICNLLRRHRIKFSFHPTMEEVIPKLDILYMTRLQLERWGSFEPKKNPYILNANMLKEAKPHLKILHPLPRNEEISKDVDETPHAYYFRQAENGLYIRQALLNFMVNHG